jgi:steroid 5-alpha reductase family enzyme
MVTSNIFAVATTLTKSENAVKKPKKKHYVCRQCIVIRYFLFAAALMILAIPVVGEKLIPLQSLTAWHFVGIIWGIGILGFAFKVIVDRPVPQDDDV